jgi:hypothetical protein
MSTLSDRLAAAARARGEVVAVRRAPVEEVALEPVPEPEPADPRRIVVAATTPATAVTPDRRAAPDAICPTCGRTGDLGVIDLPGRTADWTCNACGTMWQVGLDSTVTSST